MDRQINFKSKMLKSSPCDYIDEYLFVKGTIPIIWEGVEHAAQRACGRNKQVTFKNCAPDSMYRLHKQKKKKKLSR